MNLLLKLLDGVWLLDRIPKCFVWASKNQISKYIPIKSNENGTEYIFLFQHARLFWSLTLAHLLQVALSYLNLQKKIYTNKQTNKKQKIIIIIIKKGMQDTGSPAAGCNFLSQSTNKQKHITKPTLRTCWIKRHLYFPPLEMILIKHKTFQAQEQL